MQHPKYFKKIKINYFFIDREVFFNLQKSILCILIFFPNNHLDVLNMDQNKMISIDDIFFCI